MSLELKRLWVGWSWKRGRPADGRWGCGSKDGRAEHGLVDDWGEDEWGSKDGLRMGVGVGEREWRVDGGEEVWGCEDGCEQWAGGSRTDGRG